MVQKFCKLINNNTIFRHYKIENKHACSRGYATVYAVYLLDCSKKLRIPSVPQIKLLRYKVNNSVYDYQDTVTVFRKNIYGEFADLECTFKQNICQ